MALDVRDLSASPVLDRLLVGAAGLILLVGLCLAIYGVFSGFVPASAYTASNALVTWAVTAIAGLCGLALVLEVMPPQSFRALAVAGLVAAGIGYFAATKGVPVLVTSLAGAPATLTFEVTGTGWGSKSCLSSYIATRPGYDELPLCDRHHDYRLDIGIFVEVSGKSSDWGIVTERVRLLD